MAKYEVKKFATEISDINGYPHIFLNCEVANSSGTVKNYKYRISTDIRHDDINALKTTIDNGFTFSQNTRVPVEIREFKERSYLFLDLPSEKEKISIQVTGERLK